MIQQKTEKYRRVVVLQYAAGITSTLVALGYNAASSWMSPALPYLTSKQANSPLLTTDFDSIATASVIGSFFGFLVNPLLVKYFGTKWTLLIFAIPQIISGIMLVLNEEFTTIWISRLISGFSYCGALSSLAEYLTAISNSSNRSKLFVLMNLSSNLGNLLPLTLNLFLTYFQMNLSLMMIPIVFLAIFMFMPKSSYFDEMNKWKEKEIKINSIITSPYGFDTHRTTENDFLTNDDISIIKNKITTDNKLSPKNVVISNDYQNFTTKINISESHLTIPTFDKDNDWKNSDETYDWDIFQKVKESSFLKLFMQPNNRKALIIMMFVCCTDILAGHIPIVSYTEQLLTHPGSIMDGDQASFLMTIIKVISVLLSTQYITKIGNKKLLLISGIIGSCSMILVGFFFFLQTNKYDIAEIRWFPLVFITISEIANVIGVGNTFFALQGELFSNDVKTLAISVTNIMYMIIELIALMKFQVLLEYFGLHVIFWFFAFVFLLFPLAIFIFGPETQGKTLEEIQMEMKK